MNKQERDEFNKFLESLTDEERIKFIQDRARDFVENQFIFEKPKPCAICDGEVSPCTLKCNNCGYQNK